ncbi:MAG: YciI family protein [Proteobacteria bacterium]|nr:YciI family protein [Pseudomonadota bacterium]
MLFVVTAIDKPDSLALRMATREAHFAYARETNVIRIGGPFLDDKGDMAGSLIIFEAENLDAAKTWHANDPYKKAGLFAHSEVRPWKLTFNPIDAKI